ncbi:J domain-containing protein [Sphingomonas sp. UV9]|uniref:J domain-containing protein n=1 Tax=Sphingomonas sp. UV9 TaxID=1851410 RepID=UPI000FFBB577|nr:J domain-containing protein [Sphingomonas sp. UV9]RXD05536.1 J domain-containing protein [Sphingomonas sp. UV9]
MAAGDMPTIAAGHPLAWPTGRPRTAQPRPALFRDGGSRMTLTSSRSRLRGQIGALTKTGQPWRVQNMVLSTNIRFTASGARDQNVSRRDPLDAGVAFYFDLDKLSHVLACDRWDSVPDNIAAIAAHIEALRGQERWGVADLRQAFAGHTMLPAPASWSAVLGVSRDADRAEIDRAYRALAKTAHPNAVGDRETWDRLSQAYEQAKQGAL